MTPTEGAHWAVGRGFAVLPVWWPIEGRCACGRTGCGHAAKHPVEWLAPRGAYSASVEAAARLWHSPAAPYNVGVALGPASGIVAVDVDPRAGGDRTLAALERRLGPLPETLRVETGRGDGGYHLYFRDPGVVVRGGVGAGVEVKGRGSYVVGPGSTHISGGKYRVVADVGLMGLPDEWLAGLTRTANYGIRVWGFKEGDSFSTTNPDPVISRSSGLRPTKWPIGRREAILTRLRQARRPGRGHILNMSALVFGNMVAEGLMDRGFAERCLVEACKVNGLWAFDGERAVRREIERGLTYGMGVWRNGEREVG